MKMSEIIGWFRKNYPELVKEMKDSEHSEGETESNPYHVEGDVWTHTMMVCNIAEMMGASKENKIAALLHDIGKPRCRTVMEPGDKKPDPNGENEWKEETNITKVHFRGHEGVSAWMSIGILEKMIVEGFITEEEAFRIFKIISLHGSIFNFIDGEKSLSSTEIVFNKPKEVASIFNNFKDFTALIEQVKFDSLGRIHETPERNEIAMKLIGDRPFFDAYKNIPEKENKPTVTLLVGLPGSGKSTYIQKQQAVIISRDEELVNFGREKFNEDRYEKIWSMLSNEDQREITRRTDEKFMKAVKERKNIIVDMTNMSKKSRRKWINLSRKSHSAKAVIFFTPLETIEANNEKRRKEWKYIKKDVRLNFMKQFTFPMYNEGFTGIEIWRYKHNEI